MSATMPSGHYIPGNSLIHRLNPGVKMGCLFLLMAGVISASGITGYALVIVALVLIIWISQLPLGAVFASMVRLKYFFIFIFLLNALFYGEGDPLWGWGIFTITLEGPLQGARVVFNVLCIMTLANVLTGTTPPMDMTAGLTSIMKPLKIFRLPVEDIAMIISVALRFIPSFLEEVDLIRKAQTARGAKFESKKLRDRASSFMPLVVPIFLSAFRRADELALAMEARGYRNARNRTRRARVRLKRIDLAALTGSLAIVIFQILF